MNKVNPTPDDSSPHSAAKFEADFFPAIDEPSVASPEQLMPYGVAAKAIFVKANGLTAYNREIRYSRRAD